MNERTFTQAVGRHAIALGASVAVALTLCASLSPSAALAQEEGWPDGWPVQVSTQQGANDASSQASAPANAEYVEDEIIVTFQSGADAGDIASTVMTLPEVDSATTLDSLDLSAVDQAPADEPVVLKLEEGADAADVVQTVESVEGIASAQLNYRYQLLDDVEHSYADSQQADIATNGILALAPGVSSLTGMNPLAADDALTNDPALASYKPADEDNAWHLEAIDIEYAWEQVKTNGTVTVAVLDTGCDIAHEDLADNVLSAYAYNAYTGDPLNCDYYGHGTHVAGCVAAVANNSLGTAGSSFNAKILPINVFDAYGADQWSTTTKALVAAYDYLFEFADEHPEYNLRVVNMSLGGYGTMSADDLALKDRIHQAKERGIVSMCAGGNGINGVSQTIGHYPSDYDDSVAVTALSTNGRTPTYWCDRNSAKDICVPGEDIYSTVPLYCKMEGNANWWNYEKSSGTSMATPIASGVMALLFAARPDITADQAIEAIKATASDRLGSDDESWYLDHLVTDYGAGILSAGSAVAYVKALPAGDGLKATLSQEARDAEALLAQVISSADGADVLESKQWAESALWDALSAAAANARTAGVASTSYAEVTQARDALSQARTIFEAALQPGRMPLATDEAKTALKKLARNALADMYGITVSANGSGLAVGTQWVVSSLADRLDTAITKAQALAKSSEVSAASVDAASQELTAARGAFNAGVKTVATAAEPSASASTSSSSSASKSASSSAATKSSNTSKSSSSSAATKSASSTKSSSTKSSSSKSSSSSSTTQTAKKKAVVINKATVTASAVKKALKAANNANATKVTLGKKVKKISSKAFAKTKVKTIVLKSKKLTKAKVKNSLKSSKVKTIIVKVGTVKANKQYVKKYKPWFVKKIAGKKATVKR